MLRASSGQAEGAPLRKKFLRWRVSPHAPLTSKISGGREAWANRRRPAERLICPLNDAGPTYEDVIPKPRAFTSGARDLARTSHNPRCSPITDAPHYPRQETIGFAKSFTI